jgi:hypothetical protein
MQTLCVSCRHVREVVSGTGSRFLLCRLSQADKRFPKYPPQPVVQCDGHEDPQAAATCYKLDVLPDTFAVCRLAADTEVPHWATGEVVSITRTADELSIVCSSHNAPEEVRQESGWRCLRVVGPLDLSLVGVIASLTAALAAANISVFVISTFDTDYLLVKEPDLEAAIESLRAAGHKVG